MRTYPTLTEQVTSRDFIEAFGGYNHNIRIGEGEFYDMKNLTSTNYPVLSTRPQRATYLNTEESDYSPVAFIEKDGLWVLEVSRFSLLPSLIGSGYTARIRMSNDEIKYLGSFKYNANTKRTLVAMGAYIVVFPDNKYIDTTKMNSDNPNDYVHDMWAYYTSEYTDTENGEPVEKIHNVSYQLCKADGTPYVPNTISPTQPTESYKNGFIWLDTSVSPYSLKIYSSANNMWSSVATTYVRINCIGIGKNFKEGDGVRIWGVTSGDWDDLNSDEDNKASVIQAKGDDYIVVIGVRKNGEGDSQNTPIRIERIVPKMDFVIESNNRLWGCRYGLNRDGKVVNEIYASKLGDCTNWECFSSTSQDSYVASLGTDGEFTGAISYLGYPIFFKQNCIHTVFGNYPSNYQIQNTECRGVQIGCHNSLTIIDGTLYYKAVGGVCAYTGSIPVEIGSALGEEGRRFYGAYGGAYRHKYYLGMHDILEDENTTWLYVYDTEKGMWHKEDQYNGEEFCYCSSGETDQLYYLIANDNEDDGLPTILSQTKSYNIKGVIGEGSYADSEEIDWFAETGVIGCSTPDKKYLSRMSLRLSIGVGTRVYIYAEYDSSGNWEQIAVVTGTSLNTFTFPIRHRRCDHLRLRIVGTGEAKIYSISKTLEQGSDM